MGALHYVAKYVEMCVCMYSLTAVETVKEVPVQSREVLHPPVYGGL